MTTMAEQMIKIEKRLSELEDQQTINTLGLLVAKSEAERILWLVRAHLKKVGDATGIDRYLSKIELAAQRIISEVDNTNQRSESVSEVPPSMALREQDQTELPDSSPD